MILNYIRIPSYSLICSGQYEASAEMFTALGEKAIPN